MTSAFVDPADEIPERTDPRDGDASPSPDDDRIVDLDDGSDDAVDDPMLQRGDDEAPG